MRDFDIVKNLKDVKNDKKEIIDNIISEAFHGIGRIQLGVNLVNFCTISDEYKNYLFKTCSVDCYIFSSNIYSKCLHGLEQIFDAMREISGNIMFVNMYDAEDKEDIQATYNIIDKFVENNFGSSLYNMNIRKEVYFNANYLQDLRKKFITSKENTEQKIPSIEKFLIEYDTLIQKKDEYTAEHSRAVCKFALEMGKNLNLDSTNLQILTVGAALHDIGKYEIDVSILTKNRKLTNSEFRQIKNHPLIGKSILDAIFFEELSERNNDVIEFIVEQHHEKYDGTGYPRNLDFNFLHEYSMIVAVADSFHAMLGRSYQNPKSKDEIIENIMECSGTQFNPKYACLLCDMLRDDITSLGLVCDHNGYLKYSLKKGISELFSEAKKYQNISKSMNIIDFKNSGIKINTDLDFSELLISY